MSYQATWGARIVVQSVFPVGSGTKKRTLPEKHDIEKRPYITIQQRKCACNSLEPFAVERVGWRP